MPARAPVILDRKNDSLKVEEIDKDEKNKWKWEWLDELIKYKVSYLY